LRAKKQKKEWLSEGGKKKALHEGKPEKKKRQSDTCPMKKEKGLATLLFT